MPGCNQLQLVEQLQLQMLKTLQLQLEIRLLPVAVQLGCSFFSHGATEPQTTIPSNKEYPGKSSLRWPAWFLSWDIEILGNALGSSGLELYRNIH